MQKQRLLLTLTFVTGCATTLIISSLFFRNAPQSTEKPVSNSAETPEGSQHDNDSAKRELSRLRAELLSKDIALRTAAVIPGSADSAPIAHTAEAPSPPVQDPVAMACDALDERMLTAPVDGRKSAAMAQAIANMIQSSAIPSGIVTSTHCGSTLCKVVLRDSTPKELASASGKVAENAPKLFGGVMALDSNPGEKTLYFAKDGKDVQFTSPEDLTTVHRIEVPSQDALPTSAQSSKTDATL